MRSPSLISLVVSVDVKHHINLLTWMRKRKAVGWGWGVVALCLTVRRREKHIYHIHKYVCGKGMGWSYVWSSS